MKVPLRWLRGYIEITLTAQALAHKLTMAGNEVGSIQTTGGRWDGVVVCEVTGLSPHPNADRLQLADLNLGTRRITVVTGAPNLRVGQRVPFAPVGTELVDGHTGQVIKLTAAKIRGIVSEGMVLSEKELGISENHEGIMVLQADVPVGASLSQVLGDTILDLDITPNRPDCLSIIGIAREAAALTGETVHLPSGRYAEEGEDIHRHVRVDIADPDLCSRYCATLVTDVEIKPSPAWMQERLLAVGMRPINNIVDITNYVMMEYGQPLHAFDFHKIRGGHIIVRRALPGEVMTTLDGLERQLDGNMLLITDEGGPLAVAGIMGGGGSEVSENSTAILLESANFNQACVRSTSTKLRLRTEASLRFDKGLSPELPMPALLRATQLIVELAGGKVAKSVVDVYPGRREPLPVLLTTSRVKQVLGVALPSERILDTIASLGFSCKQVGSNRDNITLEVVPPYWRTDVHIPDDLTEEIARIIGYDEIPTTTLSGQIPEQAPDTARGLRDKTRDALVNCGMQEIITYSLVSWNLLSKVHPEGSVPGPIPQRLANPMTSEYECLRTTLRPGILATLASNQRHVEESIRLFEIGKVYLPKESGLPEERHMAVGVLSGRRWNRSWLTPGDELTFFDAKGSLEFLFEQLDVNIRFVPSTDPILHAGKTANLVIGDSVVGVVGELHPKTAESFNLTRDPAYLFEIDMEELVRFAGTLKRYRPLPRYPMSKQDIALVVPCGVPSMAIEDIIRSQPLVSELVLFDVYTGPGIPSGKKSLAYSIVYRASDRTLTDEDVQNAQKEILERLREDVGAVLRG